MKKSYLKPTALVVRVENNLMVVIGSTPAVKENEVLGREARFSDWDEEWDEE